jgi:hypothetical protein
VRLLAARRPPHACCSPHLCSCARRRRRAQVFLGGRLWLSELESSLVWL